MSSAEEASRMIVPPDLRQVTVLTKAEWLRIQDELNKVNKDKESMRGAVKQREALHLQSKEVVKLWSNTIAVSCYRGLLSYCICFAVCVDVLLLQINYSKTKVTLLYVFIYQRVKGKRNWRQRRFGSRLRRRNGN